MATVFRRRRIDSLRVLGYGVTQSSGFGFQLCRDRCLDGCGHDNECLVQIGQCEVKACLDVLVPQAVCAVEQISSGTPISQRGKMPRRVMAKLPVAGVVHADGCRGICGDLVERVDDR
ncbi:hypothetical protein LWC34_45370 [Kibdelosporangium philippinense]|uniref:Uncharacterized protein n=1 Tax=Kibdelosporangium philippinense TaxID=211113 RepID=A0ABS8ZQG7_9PSEU|nr:hypothetical protein [Kibdelosporangium philippinense]MCE7009991.1 hypothetical protein [Kibdelosporangium philippinense]